MSPTFEVSKLLTSNDVKLLQPENTPFIRPTFEVLKLLTSNDFRLAQPLNIPIIVSIFEMSKFSNPLISSRFFKSLKRQFKLFKTPSGFFSNVILSSIFIFFISLLYLYHTEKLSGLACPPTPPLIVSTPSSSIFQSQVPHLPDIWALSLSSSGTSGVTVSKSYVSV